MKTGSHVEFFFKQYLTSARAQVVKHGGVCYLSGMVAAKAPGASVAEQTKSILADIEEMLVSAGTSKAHLLTGRPGLIIPGLPGVLSL